MKRASLFVLALLCAAAVPASGAWQDLTAADFSVPPPPAPGSAADVADTAQLLSLQGHRAAADCALAQTMPDPAFSALFGGSGLLTPAQMSAAGPLLDQVTVLAAKISGAFKREYPRKRPFNENKSIVPCADKPAGATSYPSTHATVATLDACVLGQLFPAEETRLADYGQHLGDLRAIVGVHHPSDVAAGQNLGGDICSRLLETKDFTAQLAQVKASLPAP